VGWHRFRLPFGRVEGLDRREELRLVRGDLRLQRVEQPERGRQIEEMLLAPGAREISSELRGRLPTASIPVQGQAGRIAFPPDDGAHDRHAGHPGEVGDGAMPLNVHL
jgi:hypothetical protein